MEYSKAIRPNFIPIFDTNLRAFFSAKEVQILEVFYTSANANGARPLHEVLVFNYFVKGRLKGGHFVQVSRREYSWYTKSFEVNDWFVETIDIGRTPAEASVIHEDVLLVVHIAAKIKRAARRWNETSFLRVQIYWYDEEKYYCTYWFI